MSTVSHRKSGPPSGSRGQRLLCTQCQTDEHLVIESIDGTAPRAASVGALVSGRLKRPLRTGVRRGGNIAR